MKSSVDKVIWFLKKRRYRTAPPSQSRPIPFHPSPHNKSHFPYHFQLIHVSFNIEDIFSNRVSIVCIATGLRMASTVGYFDMVSL